MINIEKFELIISKINKNKLGEVFTHVELIGEMLLYIKEWEDPSKTYYDPTCGHGYFLFFTYEILMGNGFKYKGYENITGLKNVIKDENDREKHIIENMLYGTDIQQASIDECNKLFLSDKYNTNFKCIDFLKCSMVKYDNIIGNPPFEDFIDDKRKAKNSNLWRPIIIKAYTMLNDNGFMSFVCPQSWMSASKANKNMFDLFNNNDVLVLNINECRRHFKGVGSSFSYFAINKSKKGVSTEVICEYKKEIYKSKITFANNIFFPLLLTNTSMSIIRKTTMANIPKFPLKFDSYLHAYTKKDCLSKIEDNVFKHKIWHTPNAILWASKPHTSQDSWKVFISISTYYEALLVDKCGNTQGMGYILCDNEIDADKLKVILSFKIYRFIVNITRWSNWNSPDILKNLPKVDVNKTWTNELLYKEFNLTDDEIKLIETTII
jgi:hypothetical protein